MHHTQDNQSMKSMRLLSKHLLRVPSSLKIVATQGLGLHLSRNKKLRFQCLGLAKRHLNLIQVARLPPRGQEMEVG